LKIPACRQAGNIENYSLQAVLAFDDSRFTIFALMHVDIIIVGQGICGTMLSWFLQQENKTFIVFDEQRENASSQVAAGVINPVTGRRYAYTWMIDEVMPFAISVYEKMEEELGIKLISHKSIIDFFPSAQMLNAFVDRISENDTYLHSYPDQNHFNSFFSYDFGCGEIRPATLIHVQSLLSTWRKKLHESNCLAEETFDHSKIVIENDKLIYQDYTSEKIIFCDGSFGNDNPLFRLLPFAPNKGEALIIHCPDMTAEHIFKKGLMLVPLPEKDIFWVGSNYQWEFENDQPSEKFFKHASFVLDGWLKKPYSVMDHKASVRPATLERRPFVGFHPVKTNIGIFNGMGTKGTSLAPFFAHQLVQHMVHDLPITPEADVKRFSRILTR
jgi:glycine/D-amino acid oxidase-like deaminating enzyme